MAIKRVFITHKLWLTEILYTALKSQNTTSNVCLISGAFNSSTALDEIFSRENQEVQDRMINIGFTEYLKSHNGKLVLTFKNPIGDHLPIVSEFKP